jgi:hypothetical protein
MLKYTLEIHKALQQSAFLVNSFPLFFRTFLGQWERLHSNRTISAGKKNFLIFFLFQFQITRTALLCFSIVILEFLNSR